MARLLAAGPACRRLAGERLLMDVRLACVAVALSSLLGGCLPKPEPDGTCWYSLANAKGSSLDESSFTYADGCAEVEDLHRRGFRIKFPSGGPLQSLHIDGRNLEDLDLDTAGEYQCESYLYRLTVNGLPTDDENPAYDNGGYSTLNQNTAVEGDCLYATCTVSVLTPASSGTLKLHFTGHLGRGKAGAVPPFRCDYMDFGFDLTAKVTEALSE